MNHRGFLSSLFDLSFSSLITTKVIKLVYILSMIVIGLVSLVFVVAAFKESAALGLLTLLIIAPVSAFIYLVYARVFLEFVIAIFRIMETTQELVLLGRAEGNGTDNKTGVPAPPTSVGSAFQEPGPRRFDPQTGPGST